MTIRTNADIRRLREQGQLSSAEESLIANCRADEPTVLGDGDVPDGPSDGRSIPSDLLRYLICAIVADLLPRLRDDHMGCHTLGYRS